MMRARNTSDRKRILSLRNFVAGLVGLGLVLSCGLIFAAKGELFFGEQVYDETQSAYPAVPRPPMFLNDLHANNHPQARSDYPPPEASKPCPGLIENKSLHRKPDHVLVTGSILSPAMGLNLNHFRLYAYRANRLEPIPYQLDERDADRWYVLNQGDHPSGGGNGLLNADDELVFRVRDAGDRIDGSLWPAGYEKAFEIEIEDPLDQGKAWVYLLYFSEKPPPRSPEDYVDQIDHGKDGQAYAAKYYTIKYPYQSGMWWSIFGTREGGYDETNIVDHGYITLEVKFFGFFKVKLDTEDLVLTIPCYKDGPIRVVRRTEIHLKLGAMKVPIGGRYDVLFYDQYMNTPINVNIPINLKYVASSAWTHYGTDLNPNAIGSKWYSNYFPEGVTITGNPADDPTKAKMSNILIEPVDDARYFHLLTGPHATLMRRHISTDEKVRNKVDTYVTFIDDVGAENSPEYFPGQLGNTLNSLNIRDIPGGDYYALSEWYHCENFRYPEDVETYLNIINHPPTVTVREQGVREIGKASSSPLAPLFRFKH